MIKQIVFDVGQVLIAYEPSIFIHAMFKDEEACRAVLNAVFNAPAWQQADAGEATDDALIRAGILREPRYEKEIRRAVAQWHNGLRRVEGMTTLVQRLKKAGYPLYVISNFSQRFHTLTGYEDLFGLMSGILISSDEKMVKPNREIYLRFLSRYRLIAEECLFIDDLPANVEGAEAVGMCGHVFTGSQELTNHLTKEGFLR